jgi:hypothetical protein
MPLRLWHLLGGAHRAPVQVHQTPVRRRVRNHHAAAAPAAGGMRPAARCRRTHTALLRQRQGNAPLLQVRFAAATWQRSLERRELRRQVWARWSGFARCCGTRRLRPSCRRYLALALCPLRASGRLLEGRVALPLVLPPLVAVSI